MTEIVLELVDGSGDAMTVWCRADGTVAFRWPSVSQRATDFAPWREDRDAGFRYLRPCIPVIDATFAALGVKVDENPAP